MASKEDAECTLMKFIAGFLRAMAGPPRNREDPLIRQLDCWAPALDGSNLVMIGRPLWQPASEDLAIMTTRLIHITPDLQWALTLDHWYALGGTSLTLPESRDETGRADMDVPLSTELTAIPMSAARRAMEQFPYLLRDLVERGAHDDSARGSEKSRSDGRKCGMRKSLTKLSYAAAASMRGEKISLHRKFFGETFRSSS